MKRWTRAYPGAVKIVHLLGKQKDELAAVRSAQPLRDKLSVYPQDQVHPVLRSLGYGGTRRYWLEVHFADDATAEAYQAEHGGEIWTGVQVFIEDDSYRAVENQVQKWLKVHSDTIGDADDRLRADVIENNGKESLRDEDSPTAYVYINDVDAATMIKLAMGGKA